MPDGKANGQWQFWIDRGGTFTDVVARRPDGQLLTKKLLSSQASACDTSGIKLTSRLSKYCYSA